MRGAARFEALLTADQNLPYQHNLTRLPIAVVVLAAKSNRIADLRPLVSQVLGALSSLQPPTLVQIRA